MQVMREQTKQTGLMGHIKGQQQQKAIPMLGADETMREGSKDGWGEPAGSVITAGVTVSQELQQQR